MHTSAAHRPPPEPFPEREWTRYRGFRKNTSAPWTEGQGGGECYPHHVAEMNKKKALADSRDWNAAI